MSVMIPTSDGSMLPGHLSEPGKARYLGCLPSDPATKAMFASWAESGNPIIPESEWVEFDRTRDEIPILDQGQHGSCFPAGTRIRMADGTQKPIDQIRLLDKVLTAEGNIGEVVDLMVRRENESLVRLQLWGHSHLRMTEEHPVLTRRGYVKAEELQIGDWVCMPRYAPQSSNVILTSDHVETTRWTVRTTHHQEYAGVAGRASAVVTKTPLPDAIVKTANAGTIFGLFLAEGSTDSAKVVWTFNINETDTLVATLVKLLRDEWGLDPAVSPKPANHTVKVVLYGKPWAMLFESLCGNGSGQKVLGSDLMSGPAEFLKAMIDGWREGDGYERRTTKQAVTVSHDLALSMFDIAQFLGQRPSIRLSHPKPSHNVKSRRPRWDIECGQSDVDSYRCEMDERNVWRKVRGVSREEFSGHVYNMEVAGDNSYVAEGIGVHNCVGHGAASGLMLARAFAGMTFQHLSPCFIYAQINGGRDAGANISDSMEVLRKTGVSLETEVPEGVIYKNRIPPTAYETAKRFKAFDCYSVSTWEEIGTALQLGYVVVDSIRVGSGFNNLDSEGVPPVSPGMGNHCTMGGEAMKRMKNGQWKWLKRNSWALWGLRGKYWGVRAHIERQSYFDAFAIKAAASDPLDPTNPPIAS
jgi:Intein splicing domain